MVCIHTSKEFNWATQSKLIFIMNVEGKIFFSGMKSRVAKYLTANKYV